MPQVINTNIASLNAQRNLNSSQAAQAQAIQRLSSGLRINSAKDDAAGLAISDRFTTQIRGLTQASRNANDGISLAQTAEGALSQVGDNLQRIRELALQSANATNSSSDRAALNSEVTQLLAEVSRVATQTQFNGLNLLDGTFSAAQFQVGANANQIISVSVAGATTDSLGSYGGTGAAVVPANAFSATNGIVINGTTIGASTSRATQSPGFTAGSAAAKAASINSASSVTGVNAVATTSVVGAVPIAGSNLNAGDLSINGIALGAIPSSTTASSQGQTVASAVNAITAQTGVEATYDTNTGALTLTSSEGRDITLTAASAAAATRVANGTGLTSTVGGTAAVAGTDTLTFAAAAVTGNTATINGVVFTFSTAVASGTYTVASATAVTVGVGGSATATTSATDLNGAIAAAKANALTSTALTPVTATNAVATAVLLTDTRAGTAATVGRTVSASTATVVQNVTGTDFVTGGGALTKTNGGSITLSSSNSFTLTGVGTGLVDGGFSALTVGLSKLSSVAVDTLSHATSAISIVDAALAQINSQRAALGAYQNRFQSTVANLTTTSENLSAARSRILDTDFASETANLTRANVLQQAGVAVLAQANALPNSVLALLRG